MTSSPRGCCCCAGCWSTACLATTRVPPFSRTGSRSGILTRDTPAREQATARGTQAPLMSQPLLSHPAAEPGERHRVTIVDAHVPRLEELEMHQVIGYSDVPERGTEGPGAEVETEFVPRAGVDPDGPQPPQRVRVVRHHPNRVPVQPPLPHGWPEHSGHRVEWQIDGTVLVGGKARCHADQPEQRHVLLFGEGHPGVEIVPPAPDIA